MDGDPAKMLEAGAAILKPLLMENGFLYCPTGSGRGSGGNFASGEFRRADRRLEIHFRYSLGLVTYHVGHNSISHDNYMLSVLGRPFASSYPSFSDDPLEGFRALKLDLEQYGADFLSGSDEEFVRHVERATELQASRGKLP